MSPALIDYTGEVDLRTVCPTGYDAISEIQHYHNFGQNALAALISWVGIVNWYHRSNVVHECVRSEA